MQCGRGAATEPQGPPGPALSGPGAGARRRRALLFALLIAAASALACGRKGDPVPPEQRLPQPPTSLQLSGEAGALVLTWSAPRRDRGGDALESVAGYRVWRGAWPPGATGVGGECSSCPQELGIAAEIDVRTRRSAGHPPTLWREPEARPGWTYRYQVQALTRRGRAGPLSAPESITWADLPPARFTLAPQDRSALATFEPPAWPDGLEPLGYRVYGADGAPLADGDAGHPRVTVVGLRNDAEVELAGRLAARTAQGWVIEGPGARARVTPVDRVPPLAPTDLTPFADPDAVVLRWLPAGEEAYRGVTVLRGEGADTLAAIAELPGAALTYRDTGARPGQRYYYSVVSHDAAGNRSLQPRAVAARRSAPADGPAGKER